MLGNIKRCALIKLIKLPASCRQFFYFVMLSRTTKNETYTFSLRRTVSGYHVNIELSNKLVRILVHIGFEGACQSGIVNFF